MFIFNTHFVWAGSVRSVLLQWAGLKGLIQSLGAHWAAQLLHSVQYLVISLGVVSEQIFGVESFHAVTCTGTDNLTRITKRQNTTEHKIMQRNQSGPSE